MTKFAAFCLLACAMWMLEANAQSGMTLYDEDVPNAIAAPDEESLRDPQDPS